jgi:hypothetical protein
MSALRDTDYRGKVTHFVSGKTTPMLYGYGAVREPVSGSVDFATLKAAILAKGR